MMSQRLHWLDRRPWRRRRAKIAIATLAVAVMCATILPMSRPRPAVANPRNIARTTTDVAPRAGALDRAPDPARGASETTEVVPSPSTTPANRDTARSTPPSRPSIETMMARQAALAAERDSLISRGLLPLDSTRYHQFWQVTTPPRLLHSESPVYPVSAKRDSVEAWVFAEMFVGADGVVDSARVMRPPSGISQEAGPITVEASDSFPEPYATEFTNAAIAATTKYRFAPALVDSTPVKVRVANRIEFRLRPKSD